MRDIAPLQKEQVERLTEIGSHLRQAREENLLSLEEMAAKTMIQARLLRAIEQGTLSQLPEPVYIKGFIRRYGDALGLNGAEFAASFPVGKGMRVPTPAAASWKDSPAAQLRPLHLYLAYIVLIVMSVSLLSNVVGRSTPMAGSTSPSVANLSQTGGVAHATPQPSATPSTVTTPIANPSATPNSAVRVEVKLTAQSWLQVEVDGRTDFEGVMTEGSERVWTAQNQMRIRSGNAGGVIVSFNGAKPKPMGEPGAVEEATFNAPQNSASLPEHLNGQPTN